MFKSNKTGATKESNASCKITKQSATAITTYIKISDSDKLLVSNSVADIPLILHLSSVIFLNFSIDFIVSSDEIASLNVTIISVEPSLYTLSFISSGSISIGISSPTTSAMLAQISTLSISFFTFSSSLRISFVGILSNTTIEYAPVLKSFESISSPCTVFIVSGKYVKIS